MRNGSLDALRSVSAFGIVWFHTTDAPGRPLAYTGLVVFLLLTFALSQSTAGAADLPAFLRSRLHRLALPWLFWSAVYLPVFIYRFASGSAAAGDFGPTWLLVGTSIHLWYLPFAFLAGMLAVLLRSVLGRGESAISILMICLGGIATLVVSASVIRPQALPAPLPQWIYSAPSILLGLGLGLIAQLTPASRRARVFATVSTLLWCAALALWFAGVSSLTPQYALGLPLVCIAYVWPIRNGMILQRWNDLSFGVYLIHPLVGLLLEHAILRPLDFEISAPPRVLLIYLLSLVATHALRHTPIGRFC